MEENERLSTMDLAKLGVVGICFTTIFAIGTVACVGAIGLRISTKPARLTLLTLRYLLPRDEEK